MWSQIPCASRGIPAALRIVEHEGPHPIQRRRRSLHKSVFRRVGRKISVGCRETGEFRGRRRRHRRRRFLATCVRRDGRNDRRRRHIRAKGNRFQNNHRFRHDTRVNVLPHSRLGDDRVVMLLAVGEIAIADGRTRRDAGGVEPKTVVAELRRGKPPGALSGPENGPAGCPPTIALRINTITIATPMPKITMHNKPPAGKRSDCAKLGAGAREWATASVSANGLFPFAAPNFFRNRRRCGIYRLRTLDRHRGIHACRLSGRARIRRGSPRRVFLTCRGVSSLPRPAPAAGEPCVKLPFGASTASSFDCLPKSIERTGSGAAAASIGTKEIEMAIHEKASFIVLPQELTEDVRIWHWFASATRDMRRSEAGNEGDSSRSRIGRQSILTIPPIPTSCWERRRVRVRVCRRRRSRGGRSSSGRGARH